MGYTNHWDVRFADATPQQLDEIFGTCTQIIDAASGAGVVAGADGTGGPLVDCTTATICFNGTDPCETFYFCFAPTSPNPMATVQAFLMGLDPAAWAHGFCKTRRKDYDMAVTACLAVFRHVLGQDNVRASNDDETDDAFERGALYASEVTGQDIVWV